MSSATRVVVTGFNISAAMVSLGRLRMDEDSEGVRLPGQIDVSDPVPDQEHSVTLGNRKPTCVLTVLLMN